MARPYSTAEQKKARRDNLKALKKDHPNERITMCVHQMVAQPIALMPWYTWCPCCHKDKRPVSDHPHWLHVTKQECQELPKKEMVQISLF